jgi:hypothetical protein
VRYGRRFYCRSSGLFSSPRLSENCGHCLCFDRHFSSLAAACAAGARGQLVHHARKFCTLGSLIGCRGTLRQLCERGVLVIGTLLQCQDFRNVALGGGNSGIYETPSDPVLMTELYRDCNRRDELNLDVSTCCPCHGRSVVLRDASSSPARGHRGDAVHGKDADHEANIFEIVSARLSYMLELVVVAACFACLEIQPFPHAHSSFKYELAP